MPSSRRFLLSFCAAALLALALLLGWAAPSGAQSAGPTTTTLPTTPADTGQGPIHVRVSTYLMSIGKPDISSGGYTADFYLVMNCDRKCDPSTFEIRNGKITSVDQQEVTPTSQTFRVTAALTAPLELRHYPFDRHILTIEIEDRLHPVSEQVYVADNAHNGIDEAVQVPGWELRRSSLKATTTVHRYPIFDPPFDKYSLYRYEIEIGRAPLASFMKVLFPALAIMATAMLGLMLKPDKAINRLGIHTGALTAAILFHLNVTAGIPPTGYLVDGDKFMLANYAGLVAAVFSTVLIMIRFDSGVEGRAQRTYRIAQFAVPGIWLTAQAIVWLT
ncbi:MAG: hypothetical protein JWO68_3866 [Actinomycetia bacterium]|nr:hypothetical protein [Actinomycetes bacterium]